MFATQCQFCRHENVPGARFCADCGSPLHLKPCPKCGKVDDVGAAACYACGAEFPPIATTPAAGAPAPAQPDAAAPAASAAPAAPAMPPGRPAPAASVAPAARSASRTRSPAWPLVLVALLAGGLPLIWMNRANLPLPQAWRPGGSGEVSQLGTPTLPIRTPPPAGSATPPMDAPKPVPEVAPPPPPPITAPPQAAPAAEPPPPAASEPAEPQKAKAEPAPRKPRPAPVAERPRAAAPAAKEEKPKPANEAQKPTQVERPAVQECTEALAALGLCDPKKNGK